MQTKAAFYIGDIGLFLLMEHGANQFSILILIHKE